jgi:probable rRNA maturation factor
MVDVQIRNLDSSRWPGSDGSPGSEALVRIIQAAAQAALGHEAAPDQASLCVVLTDDDEIRALNRQFRGIDAPTDVLSFAMQEDNPAAAQGFVVAPEQDAEASAYLGDVIVSYPRVLSQAAEQGHSALDELRLLVVHGVLHLLGHDHATPQEQARMWAVQDLVLERLGLSGDA